MEKITVGRIVHFVLPDGQHRPAIVVREGTEKGVNLQVFLDGDTHEASGIAPHLATVWRHAVRFDSSKLAVGTCHWPEREEKKENSK
jgi:hypothetical protein